MSGHIKNLPQRIWRAMLSDTLDDIKAFLEAAKEKVIRLMFINVDESAQRKELFKKRKNDSVWINDS
jgi:hypothetical protein